MVRRRPDDSIAWIGYSDFLTTLVVLFFIVAAVEIGRNPTAALITVQSDSASARVSGCRPVGRGIGAPSLASDGRLTYAVEPRLLLTSGASLAVTCNGLFQFDSLTVLLVGDSLRILVQTTPSQLATARRMQGEANFARNSGRLSPEGIENVRRIGREIKPYLGANQIVAVQGHADDLEFPNPDEMNNFELSSQRAAAAAHVLSSSGQLVGISPCQLVSMGYGSTRPIEVVLQSDAAEEKERKREINRRIEFRIVDSPITTTACSR